MRTVHILHRLIPLSPLNETDPDRQTSRHRGWMQISHGGVHLNSNDPLKTRSERQGCSDSECTNKPNKKGKDLRTWSPHMYYTSGARDRRPTALTETDMSGGLSQTSPGSKDLQMTHGTHRGRSQH
ncbi:hypothetical protein BaRGS_00007911 [Batillaria attramentaria]|uniref:Uncharacterized protein n=1 Tax=Batillaria attramentaria TaxID=370345 RepID=A0ABD0LPE1_9CAEN